MAITPTELKEFTFVKNSTTVIKKFTSSTSYSVIIRKGDVFLNLTSSDFTDFFDAVDEANDKNYDDPA